jgi:hypothetical protein
MNVAQLLNLLATHDEIVEAPLPNVGIVLPQLALSGIPALVPQNTPRQSLLEHLHDRGLSTAFRFTDEQVKVLRHHHVSDHDEVVASANLFKDSQEQIAFFRSVKKRAATITAAGKKMKMSRVVTAMQVARHGSG